MAGNLARTADRDGVPQIGELAAQLEQAATADPDLRTIVQLTTELLDLCRLTQRCYLEVTEGSAPDSSADPKATYCPQL
jgi:hypothetical protein